MPRESEIRKFIFDTFMTGADDKDLDNDDPLIDKGIIDSMGMLELIAFAEEEYNIEVEDEEVIPDNFGTVNKLSAYVNKKLSSK